MGMTHRRAPPRDLPHVFRAFGSALNAYLESAGQEPIPDVDDRGSDHAFHLGEGGRHGWLFRGSGRPVACAMVRLDGRVGLAVRTRAVDMDPVARFVLAELAAAGVEKIRAGVTGCCEGAQRAFWEAGLVFEATSGIPLASRPLRHRDRYLAAGYGMS